MSQNSDTLAVNQLFIAANHCKFHMFSGSFICSLNPIQDELFRGCSRMRGGGGAQKDPLPKICQTYPAMFKLGAVIPYPKKIQKIYESRDTPLELC